MLSEDFNRGCDLLPEGVSWGDNLTPELALYIADAALRTQAQTEQIYQLRLADGSWIDQTEFSFQNNQQHCAIDTRIVYTHPASAERARVSDDLRDRLVAISEAIEDQDDRAAQAMLREILRGDATAAQLAPGECIEDGAARIEGIVRVQALWSSDRMSPEALRRRIESDMKWEAEHREIGAFSGIESRAARSQALDELVAESERLGGYDEPATTVAEPSESPAYPAEPFCVVVDRTFDGEGPTLAVWNGENYSFSDGDCFERETDGTLDGYAAEWLTHHQLEKRLFSVTTQQAAQQQAEPVGDAPFAWTTEDGQEPISDELKRVRADLYNKHYTVALYRAAQSGQRAGVAKGWQVVPKIPTYEMVKAGRRIAASGNVTNGFGQHILDDVGAKDAWAAMLAAAPTQQQERSE